MKEEQELLARVTRTLRDRTDGQASSSARTRERVLASVRKHNKRRSWWFKGSIPGGVLLLGTTAWAQATHQWPAVWRTIGDILSLPVSTEGNSEQELATRNAARTTSPRNGSSPSAEQHSANLVPNPEDVTTDEQSATDTPGVIDTEPAAAASSEVQGDKGEPSLVSARAVRPKPPHSGAGANEPPPDAPLDVEPKEPPSEPEIAAFRSANDLDIKQRNLGAALSAYRLYLRDFPGGRFVPEARYNLAIILVKLGHRDEARRELTPFASGKYGAHRQARAAKLLEALEENTR